MPQIGELAPRLWVASGFGGHGLNTTAMAGNIIASAIDEGDDTWRLFLPFELVWAGGRVGRAVAQVQYWWYRKRELSKARQARAREAEYHRSSLSDAGGADEHEPEAIAAPLTMTPMPVEPMDLPQAEPPQRGNQSAAVAATAPAPGRTTGFGRPPTRAGDERSASGRYDWRRLLDPRKTP
jgi:hypothetical protein